MNTHSRTEHNSSSAVDRRSKRSPFWESLLGRIGFLQAKVDHLAAVDADPGKRVILDAVSACLEEARNACQGHLSYNRGENAREFWRWRIWQWRPWSAGAAQRALSNLHAADVLLFDVIPEKEFIARAGDIRALAESHLPPTDQRRCDLEERIHHLSLERTQRHRSRLRKKHAMQRGDFGEGDRQLFSNVLSASYTALEADLVRVRRLRNVLWATAGVALAASIGLGIFGIFRATDISLCFLPQPQADAAATPMVSCPSGEEAAIPGRPINEYANSIDIILVEIAGFFGAFITFLVALHNNPPSSTPGTPLVASAALKLPAGAISAVLGILLIRGAFFPGLTFLDNSGQILAYAILFGASQQLATHFIDERARLTMASTGSLHTHVRGTDDPTAGSR